MVDTVAVKSIFAAVDAQYVEYLEEDYVVYKNQTTKTVVEQLQTWCVITTKEKLSIKAHFLDPWSNTLDAHTTTFACQLDRHQVECKDNGVTVTKADKVDHFMS